MIEEYNKLIEEIAKSFSKRLYKEKGYDCEDYYIINSNGINTGPIEIDDIFYNLEDILLCEKHNIHSSYLVDYYNQSLEEEMKLSFYNYYRKKSNKEKYEREEKESLEKSLRRLNKAKKLFFNCIKGMK